MRDESCLSAGDEAEVFGCALVAFLFPVRCVRWRPVQLDSAESGDPKYSAAPTEKLDVGEVRRSSSADHHEDIGGQTEKTECGAEVFRWKISTAQSATTWRESSDSELKCAECTEHVTSCILIGEFIHEDILTSKTKNAPSVQMYELVTVGISRATTEIAHKRETRSSSLIALPI